MPRELGGPLELGGHRTVGTATSAATDPTDLGSAGSGEATERLQALPNGSASAGRATVPPSDKQGVGLHRKPRESNLPESTGEGEGTGEAAGGSSACVPASFISRRGSSEASMPPPVREQKGLDDFRDGSIRSSSCMASSAGGSIVVNGTAAPCDVSLSRLSADESFDPDFMPIRQEASSGHSSIFKLTASSAAKTSSGRNNSFNGWPRWISSSGPRYSPKKTTSKIAKATFSSSSRRE